MDTDDKNKNQQATSEPKVVSMDEIAQVVGNSSQVVPQVPNVNQMPANSSQTVVEKAKDMTKRQKAIAVICMLLVILISIMIYSVFLREPTEEELEAARLKEEFESYRVSGKTFENFDLYFLKANNNEENQLYSPLAIKYALGILSEGAEGQTKEQIDYIINGYKPKLYESNQHMNFANAMFVKSSHEKDLKNDYKSALKDKFNTDIVADSFDNSSGINDWARSNTFDLLDKITTDQKVKNSNYILFNSLAIDMNWKNLLQYAEDSLPSKLYDVYLKHENYSDFIEPISDNQYPNIKFEGNGETQSVSVGATISNYDIIKDLGEDKIKKTLTEQYQQFLDTGGSCGDIQEIVNTYYEDLKNNYGVVESSTDFYIYNDDDVAAFAKDLEEVDGIKLQYIAIMPKKLLLSEYIDESDSKSIQKIITKLKEIKKENFKSELITKIRVELPLFKYNYSVDMKSSLNKLKITDVFDKEKANISKMTSKDGSYISDALHSSGIEFSNEGLKAAEYSSSKIKKESSCWDYQFQVPVEEIEISFNRPYMYLVRNKDNGEIWFVGKVHAPTKQE